MATAVSTTMSVIRDEGLNVVCFGATAPNIGDDLQWSLFAPTLVPEYMLLELQVWVQGAATFSFAAGEDAIGVLIADVAGQFSAPVGVGQLFVAAGVATAERVSAYVQPANPVPVRAGDRIYLFGPDLDTNASPTLGWNVYVRAVKL